MSFETGKKKLKSKYRFCNLYTSLQVIFQVNFFLIEFLLLILKFYIHRDHTFIPSTQKGGGGVLKFVKCLWILLFLNNRSIVYFCG